MKRCNLPLLILGAGGYALCLLLYILDGISHEMDFTILISILVLLSNAVFLFMMKRRERIAPKLSAKRWFNVLMGWLIVSSCLALVSLVVESISYLIH